MQLFPKFLFFRRPRYRLNDCTRKEADLTKVSIFQLVIFTISSLNFIYLSVRIVYLVIIRHLWLYFEPNKRENAHANKWLVFISHRANERHKTLNLTHCIVISPVYPQLDFQTLFCRYLFLVLPNSFPLHSSLTRSLFRFNCWWTKCFIPHSNNGLLIRGKQLLSGSH